MVLVWMKYIVAFCGSSDACNRSVVNGRLWFSKKLLSSVVAHQMYFPLDG
jgi:hypothetical protein